MGKDSSLEIKTLKRQLKIEKALDHVRSRTNSMQKSEELADVSESLFKELRKFSIELWACGFVLCDKESEDTEHWISVSSGKLSSAKVPNNLDHIHHKMYEAWRKKRRITIEIQGAELRQHYKVMSGIPSLKGNIDKATQNRKKPPNWQKNHIVPFRYGYLLIVITSQVEDIETYVRFAKVFEQTYTRFLDLKKAEAQTREAQTEAALERLRARTMAMHDTSELEECVYVLFDELGGLGIKPRSCGIILPNPENERMCQTWILLKEAGVKKHHKEDVNFFSNPQLKQCWKSWKSGETFCHLEITKALARDYFTAVLGEKAKQVLRDFKETVHFCFAHFKDGMVYGSFIKPLEQEIGILKRFAKVFEQTYTRFLDLQKAEAQAREAQIEAALERVRAATMAMHQSGELQGVIHSLREEMTRLGIDMKNALLITDYKKDKKTIEANFWVAIKKKNFEKVHLVASDSPMDRNLYNAVTKGIQMYSDTYSKKEKNKYFRNLFKNTDYRFIPEKAKKTILDAPVWIRSTVVYKNAALQIQKYRGEPYSDDENDILKRFGGVFEQAYTRFLDLQKAETQAREAKIEAALEKVRSRSLAMHQSDELQEVINTVYDQLVTLGIEMDSVNFDIFNGKNRDFHCWVAASTGQYASRIYIPAIEYGTSKVMMDARAKGEEFVVYQCKGTVKKRWFDFAFKYTDLGKMPKTRMLQIKNNDCWTVSIALREYSALQTNRYYDKLFSEEENIILKRFALVFEQAYTRFLDLQKAEEQAREAQIEAALERVRAQAMAMHHTDDLGQTIKVFYEQLDSLIKSKVIRCGAGLLWKEHTIAEMSTATRTKEGDLFDVRGKVDMMGHPHLKSTYENWLKQEELHSILRGNEIKEYYQYITNQVAVPASKKGDELHFYFPMFAEGSFYAVTEKELPEEELAVLRRFSSVLSLTYRRFNDLQKAEAQAREAQIEAALERVRSRSMAMHQSDELEEVASELFQQLDGLAIKPWRSGITIAREEKQAFDIWSFTDSKDGQKVSVVGNAGFHGHPIVKGVYQAWKNQDDSYSYDLTGKQLKDYVKYITRDFDLPEASSDPSDLPKRLIYHHSVFESGTIYAAFLNQPSEEDMVVLGRFRKVFEQSYTRFLDLQKAEEQAREAQIEASLERVRAKAMAMHHSDHVTETVGQLFHELNSLDISLLRCGVGRIYNDKLVDIYTFSGTKKGVPIPVIGKTILTGHPVLDGYFQGWVKQEEFHAILKGASLKKYYQALNTDYKLPGRQDSLVQYMYSFPFTAGCLYTVTETELSEEELSIFRKFTSVVGLTFRRYLDLIAAEKRAGDAIKESSLDRVRAEIASMRSTQDLDRITPLIWRELTTLGVPFFRCGVFIIEEDTETVHMYLTSPAGKPLAALNLDFDEKEIPLVEDAINHWRKQTVHKNHWDKEQFAGFSKTLQDRGLIQDVKTYQQGEKPPENLHLHQVPFKQGMLYVGNDKPLSDDQIELVQSLADAFSVAYARYDDFVQLEDAKERVENTLTDLQAAQNQLIHSEKMASLGELTAGIAHEIQNPLNFVNNFSDINKELVDELEEEIEKGDKEEIRAILRDLRDNEEKVTHHGKRAEGIVKSMLQHSRGTEGQKELTDINALCDEYLRLAYHGFRAKDQSFNCDYNLDLDSNVPKIEVVPQDIGRVLLNLINNAFQAVKGEEKPEVIVTTRSTPPLRGDKGGVQIIISDNGPGIPKSIKEKIFEPFFTTKPTGEGTGLGLSMSYDIVTKGHGGALRVEAESGKGSKFIITLPVTYLEQ